MAHEEGRFPTAAVFAWLRRHPIWAIVSVVFVSGNAIGWTTGIWSGFSSDPLFPAVYAWAKAWAISAPASGVLMVPPPSLSLGDLGTIAVVVVSLAGIVAVVVVVLTDPAREKGKSGGVVGVDLEIRGWVDSSVPQRLSVVNAKWGIAGRKQWTVTDIVSGHVVGGVLRLHVSTKTLTTPDRPDPVPDDGKLLDVVYELDGEQYSDRWKEGDWCEIPTGREGPPAASAVRPPLGLLAPEQAAAHALTGGPIGLSATELVADVPKAEPPRSGTTKFGPRKSDSPPVPAPPVPNQPESLYSRLVADGVERSIAHALEQRASTPEGRAALFSDLLTFVDAHEFKFVSHQGTMGFTEHRHALCYDPMYHQLKPFLSQEVQKEIERMSLVPALDNRKSPQELRRLIRRDVAAMAKVWGVTL